MKIKFNELEVKTLDGQLVPDIDKSLANNIYSLTKDLGLVEIARKIYNREEVELTQIQVDEIKRIIEDEKTAYFAFVKKALLDFIANYK